MHARAPPAVERLILVADHEQVIVRRGEHPHQQLLRRLDVLVLVDQHMIERRLPPLARRSVAAQQAHGEHDHVVEVIQPPAILLALNERVDARDAAAVVVARARALPLRRSSELAEPDRGQLMRQLSGFRRRRADLLGGQAAEPCPLRDRPALRVQRAALDQPVRANDPMPNRMEGARGDATRAGRSSRSRSSAAAASLNVMHRIRSGSALRASSSRTRSINTVVLPDPAGAITCTTPPGARAAASCASSSDRCGGCVETRAKPTSPSRARAHSQRIRSSVAACSNPGSTKAASSSSSGVRSDSTSSGMPARSTGTSSVSCRQRTSSSEASSTPSTATASLSRSSASRVQPGGSSVWRSSWAPGRSHPAVSRRHAAHSNTNTPRARSCSTRGAPVPQCSKPADAARAGLPVEIELPVASHTAPATIDR